MRKLLGRILSPVMRLMLRWVDVPDPWEPVGSYVRLETFGSGSRRPFAWYLEGVSLVRVSSVQDVTSWLLGCQYASDPDLFHEPDFWQHPKTFEALRRGDCEDFAVWAWRKLIELGLEAHLFVGHIVASGPRSGHAWVVFETAEGTFLMEPVARTLDEMLRPLETAKQEYAPHVSVDRAGKKRSYAGYLLALKAAHHVPRTQAA